LRLVCFLGLVSLAAACGQGETALTDECLIGVTVSPPSATLHPGDSLRASATVACAGRPADARWTSSDPTIASVDSVSGVVHARSVSGDATITASLTSDRAVRGALVVKVVP
jgi:uncharacterized protein YjdB